ncbi:MAG: glycosyltransferase family 39 protein [bacterium]|nr:glycosyltransferase family 39 protein [bacterium]
MKFNDRKIIIVLVFVIFIAVFLRFYNLGEIPPGLTNDEANIGYDAYSILKTGKDQWGNFLPLTAFKGFGDFRPPLYTYLTVPSIAIFGLNEFAVRFPSAIVGVLTVIAAFFLGKKLFRNTIIGILSALILALNPWHIGMSRVGIESNLSVFLVTLGVLFFLKGKGNPKLFFLSLLFFTLSLYAYTANLLFTPFIFLSLILIYRPLGQKSKKTFFAAVILAIIMLLPFFLNSPQGTGKTRFGQVNLGKNIGLVNTINEKRGECQKDWNATFCRITFNKGVAFSFNFLGNYAQHFSPELLLTNGTITQLSVLPPRGLLFHFEFFLLPLGIWFLLKRKDSPALLLLAWLFLAPVADSLTGNGHYSRAFVFLPSLQIVSAYGLYQTVRLIKFRKIYLSLIALLILFEISTFIPEYFSYYPRFFSRNSHYGYKELVSYLEDVKDNYDQIVVSSRYNDTKQYAFFLFFTAYDPVKFQTSREIAKSWEEDGWLRVEKIDNWYFAPSLPSGDEFKQSEQKILLVGAAEEFPPKITVRREIDDLKGDPLFKAVDIQDLLNYDAESKR